jgi:hypothetical protein
VRIVRPAADVRALTARAITSGAVLEAPLRVYPDGRTVQVSQRASWDIKGRCKRPVVMAITGEGHMQMDLRNARAGASQDDARVWQSMRHLDLMAPCRKCSECLRTKMIFWGKRAAKEFRLRELLRERSGVDLRTWFGTLTFSPEERYRLLAATRARLDEYGCVLEGLSPADRFAEQGREAGKCVTDFLKRLRKGGKRAGFDPAEFKYFLAVEPHKDWSPHFHILVHELNPAVPIKKKALEGQWPHGFVQWRLVKDERAAFYAAKYLSKFSIARVRASLNYGRFTETTENALEA